MAFSLMNGLSALGGSVSQFAGVAALDIQKSQLAQQAAILADQLATTRETKLQGQAQEFQKGQQERSQIFQGGESALNRTATKTNLDATIAAENARSASSNAAAMDRERERLRQEPETIRILRILAPEALPDSARAAPSASSSNTKGTMSGASTPDQGASDIPTDTSGTDVSPPKVTLGSRLVEKALGLDQAGSPAANRLAIAQDVAKEHPYWTAGQRAAEIEGRVKEGNSGPYPGNSPEAADNRILLKGDQSTPEAQLAYANAFARQRTQKTDSGIAFQRDMSMFKTPLLPPEDGGPLGQSTAAAGGRNYGNPQATIAPNAPSAGDQSKLRQIEVEGSGIKAMLEKFRAARSEAGGMERLATAMGVPTETAAAYTNSILLAKGQALFELGVLNGKDLEVLHSTLADPSTFKGGVMVGQETVNKQIDLINGIIDQKVAAATEHYGGGAPRPGGTTATAAPKQPAATGGWTVKRID